jgi:uncharacterized protein (TIGR00299 family) protein
MALGALVDLGVDRDKLIAELGKLEASGWSLRFTRDSRSGIFGTRALVELEGDVRDEQHHHIHNHAHSHVSEQVSESLHIHVHEHAHTKWGEIRALIQQSGISEGAKNRAVNIFARIAAAEAEVHGVAVDEVAFHEVGALDSIIDIVGTAICLDMLNPDKITATAIELGGGTVRCAHGILPVPAPAVQKLCVGLPVKTGGFDAEMTTPTGAAIIASSVDEFITEDHAFTERASGTGIGFRKFEKPNILRVSLRDEAAGVKTDSGYWQSEELTLIEANIDDMTGEALSFLMESLFEAGALDVTFSPCTMKKSRPGMIAACLCPPDKLDALRRTMFEKSSTIGFRETAVRRLFLSRESSQIDGPAGKVSVKTVSLGDSKKRAKIEAHDREQIARKLGCNLDQAGAFLSVNPK